MTATLRKMRIVVLGNGAAGAEKQALALAARLRAALLRRPQVSNDAGDVAVERVALELRGVARRLPPFAHVLLALATGDSSFGYARSRPLRRLLERARDPESGRSVVIGCGRSTVALSALLKRAAPASVANLQVQHPRAPLAWFDAVVAPRHDFRRDGERPENALVTTGTVFDVTPELLEEELERWRDRLDELTAGRARRAVWLVGGPCRGFTFSMGDAEAMAAQVAGALGRCNGEVALLVSFSRRTPAQVRLAVRHRLAVSLPAKGSVTVWDGTEAENPYYALLATASVVITTPDSISMTTEAVASGAPVLTLLAHRCRGKFSRFHRHLQESGCADEFSADLMEKAMKAQRTVGCDALEKELQSIVERLVDQIEVE